MVRKLLIHPKQQPNLGRLNDWNRVLGRVTVYLFIRNPEE